MNEIQLFLLRYAEQLKIQVRNELARPRDHSPGYDRNAYSNGRNPKNKGSFAISDGGDLWNSVNTIMIDDNYGFELEINDYYWYVDQGVKPHPEYLKGKGSGGSSAFISSLTKWAAGKGFNDPLGAAFAIRRNIFKFGIVPTNFMGDALDNISVLIEEEFGDAADKWIDVLLEGFEGISAEQE
jgi:hypothetical protein